MKLNRLECYSMSVLVIIISICFTTPSYAQNLYNPVSELTIYRQQPSNSPNISIGVNGTSSDTLTNAKKDTTNEIKYKHNKMPVIAFGLAGLFIGARIGSEIDPPTSMPGEIPEIFTVGNVVGSLLGGIIGGSIGYKLGKEEIAMSSDSTATNKPK